MFESKRRKLSPALEAAVRAISELVSPPVDNPKQDSRLIVLKQLHEMNRESLERARFVEYAANQAKLSALAAYEETKVRIEILEIELGIEPEEDAEEESA